MRKQLFIAVMSVAGVASAAPSIEVGFSPEGSAQTLVLRSINQAHSSIDMMAYEFQAPDIVAALGNAAERGVRVDVVIDSRCNRKNAKALAAIQSALSHSVHMRIDSHYHIQHDKVMIIDGSTLETGSFNYTVLAEKENSENLIVVKDAPDLIRQYEAHFAIRWQLATPIAGERGG
ncbi:phospholipase D family protein [Obesumbacterium proteus]|uniref:phospholipase D n=1 Tax=Obesumbacterium proteus ATCC 12841 TaxID=1354268 RepID=A0AA91EBH5_9GAMM|nr:phospholipase D family protein [Obesumbacterium proteus]AMO82269.1 endonuclease [Obesumbacterium proteus]OAT57586.1 plasmid conjugative transfer endonuclease [Obesumbacterium proteus ATCC 12841]